ncbi:hypothetical protein Cob_v010827 [Colletotrichum orbiculare MAFF 240422]|uniref:C2H2-type domain-containing protein n=1 Tax=Colletotrichum orbiculare (strain 104-T / ATCC 96160 / CBS 514.97 / LARS 414 / MAFF 240422) TaxID=1213857 RepID=A0A484FED2_COLOR|nr:hypothetical protein Cob_v010827 [Colletotrichum orbiculare MAFF 240422]
MCPLEWLENRQADFNIWASSIKAASEGRSSLDYRVRERPDLKETISNLLDALLEILGQVGETVSHETAIPNDPREESDPKGTGTSSSPDNDDFESSDASSIYESDLLAEEKENIKTILHQLARLSSAIRASGIKYRYAKADATLKEDDFVDLKDHLTALINIFHFRNTQSERQFLSDQTELKPEHFINTEFDGLTTIQKRLINANIIRCNRVRYATRNKHITEVSNDRKKDARGNRNMFPGAKVEYPRCPKPTADGLIECPWCGNLLDSGYYIHPKKWKNHVAQDILPYVCIFEPCSAADELYLTKEELEDHVRREHGVTQWLFILPDL